VKDLAVRLAALDADAGAALQVIAYFDSLVEARAGLRSIVRGAAVLSGCPARLEDSARRLRIRVSPDGASSPGADPGDPAWLRMPILADGTATLWLERPGPAGPVEAMILERASGAARGVLDRTRGRTRVADPASVELVLDGSADPRLRDVAARGLGLPADRPVHAIALAGGAAVVAAADTPLPPGRAGVGPPGTVLELPASWTAARTALRFTAEGTDEDPGPTVVHYARLGALVLLAGLPNEPIPDVRALEHAASGTPWLLRTLDAVAGGVSLRAAAAALRVHHSTLQDRIGHAEHLLGWNVREPQGRLRLQLALALRRLHRNPSHD
jgi:PucR C-terminal helix-turn-helix domain